MDHYTGRHPGRVTASARPQMRVPAHDGRDSGVMPDTIPAARRTPFRADAGHFGRSAGMLAEPG